MLQAPERASECASECAFERTSWICIQKPYPEAFEDFKFKGNGGAPCVRIAWLTHKLLVSLPDANGNQFGFFKRSPFAARLAGSFGWFVLIRLHWRIAVNPRDGFAAILGHFGCQLYRKADFSEILSLHSFRCTSLHFNPSLSVNWPVYCSRLQGPCSLSKHACLLAISPVYFVYLSFWKIVEFWVGLWIELWVSIHFIRTSAIPFDFNQFDSGHL